MLMTEQLVRFLVREYDRDAARGQPAAGHVEDAAWALLADGLISPAERDAVLDHAAACPACRKRLSLVTRELPDGVLIAGGAPSKLLAARPAPVLLRLRRFSTYAAAAVVLLAVGAGIWWRTRPGPARPLLPPDLTPVAVVALTDLGVDLRRRTVRDNLPVAMTADNYRKVLATLDPELQKPSPRPDALTAATRAALAARFAEDALAYAQRWATAAPNDDEAANAVGLAAYLLNRFDEALAAFERALTLVPAASTTAAAELHLNAALAAAEIGDTGKVRSHLQAFKNLLHDDPRIPEIDRWLARLGP